MKNSFYRAWQEQHGIATLDEKIADASPRVSLIELHSTLVDLIGYADATAFEKTLFAGTLAPQEITARLQNKIREARENLTAAVTTGNAVTTENGYAPEQENAANQQVAAVLSAGRRSRQPGFVRPDNAGKLAGLDGLFPSAYDPAKNR